MIKFFKISLKLLQQSGLDANKRGRIQTRCQNLTPPLENIDRAYKDSLLWWMQDNV